MVWTCFAVLPAPVMCVLCVLLGAAAAVNLAVGIAEERVVVEGWRRCSPHLQWWYGG